MARKYVLYYDKLKDELQRNGDGNFFNPEYAYKEEFADLNEVVRLRNRYEERGFRTKIIYIDD